MTSAQIQNMIIFMTFGSEVLAHILTACWRYGVCKKPSVIHMKSRQLKPVISATFVKDAADVLLIASMAQFGIRFSFQSSSVSTVTDVCGERCVFLLKVTKGRSMSNIVSFTLIKPECKWITRCCVFNWSCKWLAYLHSFAIKSLSLFLLTCRRESPIWKDE